MSKLECEALSLHVHSFPMGLLKLGEKLLSVKKGIEPANLVEAIHLVIQIKYLLSPLTGS